MRTADKTLENRNPLLLGRIVNHNNTNATTVNDHDELWSDSYDEDDSYEYQFEEEHRDAGDYINCDRSDYNRDDSRFGWFEPEE